MEQDGGAFQASRTGSQLPAVSVVATLKDCRQYRGMRPRLLPAAALLVIFCALVSAAAAQPNIIFILADDLGYADLGCYGQKKIRTPNIDKLASEGMRFTQFYAGNAVCAPSRCALLTGKHMGHAAIRDNLEKGPTVEGQQPMPRDTKTVAQALKAAGYSTGIIGKWGLGMPEDHSGPGDFGFDYHYGYLCQRVAHTYYPEWLWRNGVKEMLPGNPPFEFGKKKAFPPGGQNYSHDLMAADALRWVREQKEKPFFLYLAFTIPHVSLQVPEDSLAEYAGKFPETPFEKTNHYAPHPTPHAAYAAMVTRMDRDIGRLMELLRELGLDEKTCVFFASDNGATVRNLGADSDFFRSNNGSRGYKGEMYEGGIRAPLIARWLGKIKPASTNDFVGAFWDLFPTFCELAGAPPPADVDGLSIAPTLLGKEGQKEHDYLYWEIHAGLGHQAVRMKQWKAVRNRIKNNPTPSIELYDLASDPGEQKDMASAKPEIAAQLAENMKSARVPSPVAKWNFGER
jgi:arylsulfatase